MRNQTEYLSAKKRVAMAWTLIVVALMCQFSGLPGIVNIFIFFAAVAIHALLVRPVSQPWISRTMKIATLIFVPTITILHSLHRMPPERVVYFVIALLAIPFLAAQLVSDLKRINRSPNQ